MSRNLIIAAAILAGLSVSAAQAQDTTNTPSPATSQTDANTAPPTDSSSYGGARPQSASGGMTKAPGTQQPPCVGPASFCDIFKGGA